MDMYGGFTYDARMLHPLTSTQKDAVLNYLSLGNKISNGLSKVWKGFGIFVIASVIFNTVTTAKETVFPDGQFSVFGLILSIMMLVFGIGMPYLFFIVIGNLMAKAGNVAMNAVKNDTARICICDVRDVVRRVSHRNGNRHTNYYAVVTIDRPNESGVQDEFEVKVSSNHGLTIGGQAYLVVYNVKTMYEHEMDVFDMSVFSYVE